MKKCGRVILCFTAMKCNVVSRASGSWGVIWQVKSREAKNGIATECNDRGEGV